MPAALSYTSPTLMHEGLISSNRRGAANPCGARARVSRSVLMVRLGPVLPLTAASANGYLYNNLWHGSIYSQYASSIVGSRNFTLGSLRVIRSRSLTRHSCRFPGSIDYDWRSSGSAEYPHLAGSPFSLMKTGERVDGSSRILRAGTNAGRHFVANRASSG